MKKASGTRDTSRGTRIATLERELAQLLSQLTALQTRVGTLEGVNSEHQKAVSRQLETVAEPSDRRAQSAAQRR
jgi:hypothetical protein